MPYGNRKGPFGMGQRTGRGFGLCNGNPQPGYVNTPGPQRGFGYRCGRHGMGGVVDEKNYLKEQIVAMEQAIQQMKDRLNDLETGE